MTELSRREKEREARKAEIVAAAEAVFRRSGYADASMDEIAKAAQFTKRTVYQYFRSKEDLLCAVALEGNKQLLARQQAALLEGGTGLDRFRRAALAYYEFCQEQPHLFQLMEDARRLKPKGEPSPHRLKLVQFRRRMLEEYMKVLAAGQEDGSIRADLEVKQEVYAVVLILAGFFQAVSETVQAGGLDLDSRALVDSTLALLADALRARGTESRR